MATRNNPFGMSVDLNSETLTVDVKIKERESGDVIDEHSFNPAEFHDDVKQAVYLYGASKLYQDRSSQVKTGPEKLAAMQEVHQQLVQGNWERERKVGSPVVSAEVEALARLKNGTVPQAQASLKALDKAQRERVLSHPEVVKLAKAIREEREQADTLDLADMAGPAEVAAA